MQVQHLIEKCLIMYMDLDDCCKSLAKYARVKPAVTVAGENLDSASSCISVNACVLQSWLIFETLQGVIVRLRIEFEWVTVPVLTIHDSCT